MKALNLKPLVKPLRKTGNSVGLVFIKKMLAYLGYPNKVYIEFEDGKIIISPYDEEAEAFYQAWEKAHQKGGTPPMQIEDYVGKERIEDEYGSD